MKFEYTELCGMDSSVIDTAAYNENTSELLLRFRSGNSYTYADVRRGLYLDLAAAASPGRFYNANIAGSGTLAGASVELVPTRLEKETKEKLLYTVHWDSYGIENSLTLYATSDTEALEQVEALVAGVTGFNPTRVVRNID